jgi:DNA-binding IclR family transcriptional regulator
VTREAPAVERVVKLLRFLAEHPGREFGLTELSTAVEINKATCHAMLVTLDRHALVHRDEVTKKYSLDAGLLSLADAVAPNASRALSLSQSVIADMSRELDLPCFATMLLHGHTVIAARVALGSVGFVEGQAAVVGHRQRWRPPIGPIFAAWAAPELPYAGHAG